jgi:hypothetical protein
MIVICCRRGWVPPRVRGSKIKPITRAMAGELNDVAKAVEALLKLSCMRNFEHRRDVIKELLSPNMVSTFLPCGDIALKL